MTAQLQQWNVGHRGNFDTIQANLQRFNTETDGLHDTARLTLGLRLPTWCHPRAIEQRVRDASNDGNLVFTGHANAHRADRTGPLPGALSSAIAELGGRPTATVKTGTSDMNTVAEAWNCPILAYGPGDSTLDHTPHERLELAEYVRSIEVLKRALSVLAERLSEQPTRGAPSALSCP